MVPSFLALLRRWISLLPVQSFNHISLAQPTAENFALVVKAIGFYLFELFLNRLVDHIPAKYI